MSTRDGEQSQPRRGQSRQPHEPGLSGEPDARPRGRDRQPRGRRKGSPADDAQSYWGGYDILWGVKSAGPAARRSPLDRTRIVRAAVRIGDAEGLAAVSMRRIARELRTGAMSLYRHVPDKGALISLMIDEVIGEADVPAGPSGNWREDLRQVASNMWELTQRHPWYAEAAMDRPPITPHGVAMLEYALSILDDSGLSIGDRMGILATLSTTVMGAALNAEAEARTRTRLQMTEDEMLSSASVYLGRIIDGGEFPRFGQYMTEVMSKFASGAEPPDPQYELRMAVELVLDGVAARLAAAQPLPAQPGPAVPGASM
jgi:AcrR family transcriptional regulator